MITRSNPLIVIAALVALEAAPAVANDQVWVVNAAGGPGVDATTIQAAIDAAADGDTILVKSGVYGGFTIFAKGVSVVADIGASVLVQNGCSVRALTAGMRVHLRGLRLEGLGEQALLAKNNAGGVWLEACELRGANGAWLPPPSFQTDAHPAADIDNCALVVMTACTLRGGDGASVDDEDVHYHASDGGEGLAARASHLTLFECTFRGGDGGSLNDTVTWPGGDGGDGARLESGTIFASGCSFTGGNGGYADFDILDGCGAGGPGGDGLDITPGPTVSSHLDCTFAGGTGGNAFAPCSPGAPGLPIRIGQGSDASLPGTARVSNATSPHREGQAIQFTFFGVPGDSVHVLYAESFDNLPIAGITGPLLPSVFSLDFFSAGVLGPSGQLVYAVTAPALPPAVEGRSFFTQPLFVAPGPAYFLGAPTAVTLLDSGL
jgi:hypothetical protein